jgi:hypothetical protein
MHNVFCYTTRYVFIPITINQILFTASTYGVWFQLGCNSPIIIKHIKQKHIIPSFIQLNAHCNHYAPSTTSLEQSFGNFFVLGLLFGHNRPLQQFPSYIWARTQLGEKHGF